VLLGRTIRTNCHPDGDSPFQGIPPQLHDPPVTRGPDGLGGKLAKFSSYCTSFALRVARRLLPC
jgi:hypothetical protein